MQNNDIKAFRQRLVRGGFTNIRIYHYKFDLYSVYCISSSGEIIDRLMSIFEIRNTPHEVWFD